MLDYIGMESTILKSAFSSNTFQQVYSIEYRVSTPIILLSTAYLFYSPFQTSSNIKYMSVLNNMLTLAYHQLIQTITNV